MNRRCCGETKTCFQSTASWRTRNDVSIDSVATNVSVAKPKRCVNRRRLGQNKTIVRIDGVVPKPPRCPNRHCNQTVFQPTALNPQKHDVWTNGCCNQSNNVSIDGVATRNGVCDGRVATRTECLIGVVATPGGRRTPEGLGSTHQTHLICYTQQPVVPRPGLTTWQPTGLMHNYIANEFAGG